MQRQIGDPDAQWFADHPDRKARIRKPLLTLHQDKQRRQWYDDECSVEFRSLGEHKKDRRRIILWKVPMDNLAYNPARPAILKIPMLLFSDETIEDRDDILLPIIDELMKEKAVEYGIQQPSMQ